MPVDDRRCVVKGMNGFFALKRLKTSPIASTRTFLHTANDRLTRRFSCEKGARRLQCKPAKIGGQGGFEQIVGEKGQEFAALPDKIRCEPERLSDASGFVLDAEGDAHAEGAAAADKPRKQPG